MAARYRPCGVVLARSTTSPGELGIPRHLDLADDAVVAREGMAWLEKLWARDDVRDAITLASPVLCERVSGLLAGGPGPARTRDLRRAVQSVASYMLRWQQRVTPFGLFAGVLPAGTGPASASIGTRHRVTARADAGWISALAEGRSRCRACDRA